LSLWFLANGQAGYGFVVQYRRGTAPSTSSWRVTVLVTSCVGMLTSILWMLWVLHVFMNNRRLRARQQAVMQELAQQGLPTAVGLEASLLKGTGLASAASHTLLIHGWTYAFIQSASAQHMLCIIDWTVHCASSDHCWHCRTARDTVHSTEAQQGVSKQLYPRGRGVQHLPRAFLQGRPPCGAGLRPLLSPGLHPTVAEWAQLLPSVQTRAQSLALYARRSELPAQRQQCW
jgi:hypothetical protein